MGNNTIDVSRLSLSCLNQLGSASEQERLSRRLYWILETRAGSERTKKDGLQAQNVTGTICRYDADDLHSSVHKH